MDGVKLNFFNTSVEVKMKAHFASKRFGLLHAFIFIIFTMILSKPVLLFAQTTYEEPVFREAKLFLNIYGVYADTVAVFGKTIFGWSDRYFNGATDVIDMELANPKLYGEIEGFDCISILGKDDLPSPGRTEFPGPEGDFPAESFFDVFYKLYAPMLFPDTLHTSSPMHITAAIDQMPPYFNEYNMPSGSTVFLYDVSENVMGEITYWQEEMIPYSAPEAYVTAETGYGSDIAIAYNDTVKFSAAVAGYVEPDFGMPPCYDIEPLTATFGIRESGTGNPFVPFYTDSAGLGEEVGTVVPTNEGDGWAGYLDISSYPDAGGLYDVEVIFDFGTFALYDTIDIFIDPNPIIPLFNNIDRDSIAFFNPAEMELIIAQNMAHANEVNYTTAAVKPLSPHWKRTLEGVNQHDLTKNRAVGDVACGPAAAASCLKFWAKNGYPKLEHAKGDTSKAAINGTKMGKELLAKMKPKSKNKGTSVSSIAKGINSYLKGHGYTGWSVERKSIKDMTDFAAMMREFESDSEDVIMIVSDTKEGSGNKHRFSHALTMGSRKSITYIKLDTQTSGDSMITKETPHADQKIDFMDPWDGVNSDEYDIYIDSKGKPHIKDYSNTDSFNSDSRIDGYVKVSPPSGSKSKSALSLQSSKGRSAQYRLPSGNSSALYGSWTVVDSVPTKGDSQPDTLHWDTTGFPGGLYLLELRTLGADGRVGTSLRFAAIPEFTVDAGTPEAAVLPTAIRSSFPNPFNPMTTIEYSIAKKTSITMRIFDVSGRLVTTLIEDEVREPGIYRTTWDGSNSRGTRVTSGMYFCVLKSGRGIVSKKLILLR